MFEKLTKSLRLMIALLAFVLVSGLIHFPTKAKALQAASGGSTGMPDTVWYTANPSASSFIISNGDELAGLAAIVNAGTDYFDNKTIKLGDDIDISGYTNWTRIGSSAVNVFKGIFDGRNYMITGLTVNHTSTNQDSLGLFGRLDGGVIKNLYVSGSVHGWANAYGGIAGRVTGGGRIINCHFTGSFSASNESSSNAGGIAGLLEDGDILNSSSDCIITFNFGSNSGSFVGGIAGRIGVSNGTTTASIINCFSTGTITCGSNGNNNGGIAGYVYSGSLVSYCYSTVTISGGINLGGIAGICGGAVSNCAALNASITGNSQLANYSGRVVYGYGSGYAELSNNYALSDMKDFNGVSTAWDNKALDTMNGADVSMETAKTIEFWSTPANWESAAWSDTIWQFTEGDLATLKSADLSQETVSISDAKVTLSQTDFVYNGQLQKPTLTVEKNDQTLLEGTDYIVSIISVTMVDLNNFSNQTSAGIGAGKVTLKIAGVYPQYEGEITKQYVINKANYDMNGISFNDVTVKYDGYVHDIRISGTLPDGVTVEYKNNFNSEIGTHTATAKFSVANKANYNTPADMTATLTIKKGTDTPPWVLPVAIGGGIVILSGGFSIWWFLIRKKKIIPA